MKYIIILFSILIIGCGQEPIKEWYNDIPPSMSSFEVYTKIQEHYPECDVYKVSTNESYILIPTDTLIGDSSNVFTIGLDGCMLVTREIGFHPNKLLLYKTHQYNEKSEE